MWGVWKAVPKTSQKVCSQSVDPSLLQLTGVCVITLLLLCCSHCRAQTIAAKGALVSQMQEELKHLKAGHSQANKAHEAHIAQLITSIKEMQELCANQVGTVVCRLLLSDCVTARPA